MEMLENHGNILLSSERTVKIVRYKKLYGKIQFFWTEKQWETISVKRCANLSHKAVFPIRSKITLCLL